MTDTTTKAADSFEDQKEQYKPDVNTLSGIFRNPTANPLATAAATLILAVFAVQAYITAVEHSIALGLAVIAAAYVSYRIARVGWKVENDFIAGELARRDLKAE